MIVGFGISETGWSLLVSESTAATIVGGLIAYGVARQGQKQMAIENRDERQGAALEREKERYAATLEREKERQDAALEREKERKEDEVRKTRAALLGIGITLVDQMNYSFSRKRYYVDNNKDGNFLLDGRPIFKIPLRGSRQSFSFTKDEKSSALSVQDSDFINDLLLLENYSRIIVNQENQYIERFDKFLSSLKEQGSSTVEQGEVKLSGNCDPVEQFEIERIFTEFRNALRSICPQVQAAMVKNSSLLARFGFERGIALEQKYEGYVNYGEP